MTTKDRKSSTSSSKQKPRRSVKKALSLEEKASLLVDSLSQQLSGILSGGEQQQASREFFEQQLKAILLELVQSTKKSTALLGSYVTEHLPKYSQLIWESHVKATEQKLPSLKQSEPNTKRKNKKQKTDKSSPQDANLWTAAGYRHALQEAGTDLKKLAPIVLACDESMQDVQAAVFDAGEKLSGCHAFCGAFSHVRPFTATGMTQLLLQELSRAADAFNKAPATRDSLVAVGEVVYRIHAKRATRAKGGQESHQQLELEHEAYSTAMATLLLQELLLITRGAAAAAATGEEDMNCKFFADALQPFIVKSRYILRDGDVADPHGSLYLFEAIVAHFTTTSPLSQATDTEAMLVASVLKTILNDFNSPQVPLQGERCLKLALAVGKAVSGTLLGEHAVLEIGDVIKKLVPLALPEMLASWAASVGITTFADLFDATKVSPVQLRQGLHAHGRQPVDEEGEEDSDSDDDVAKEEDDLFFMDTDGDVEARRKMGADLSALMDSVKPESSGREYFN